MAPEQPFDGVTVVEFGQFVAVPFCAQLLADGGARVIKIETLAGDPVRRLMPVAPGETRIFLSRNRGKRSLPLDLRHPEAPAVIDGLLRSADVAVMNFRPGLAEEHGLDPATLQTKYPRLIIGQVTPFGRSGPDALRAGMDIVVQARSGLMVANGRSTDGRPAQGDPVSADYMCAMTLAFGLASALLRRERTGQGGVVHTSLMQAALTLNNNQMLRIDSLDREAQEATMSDLGQQRQEGASYPVIRANLPSTRPSPMFRVYFRTYDTADGWIAVACGSHGLRERFLRATGLIDDQLEANAEEVPESHYAAMEAEAEHLFASRSTAEWELALSAAGVPVSEVKFPFELFDDEQAAASGMFHDLAHPSLGNVRVLAPPVSLDADGFRGRERSEPLGSETRALLSEIGFSQAEAERLIASGVTREG